MMSGWALPVPGSSKRMPARSFKSSISNPVNPNECNINRKYMIPNDQYNTRHAPILKFYAQFDDRGEHPRDHLRFRNCHVLYFVEDGTIKVYEALQKNSGFDQGILISRNIIPKPEGGWYKLEDLNVGKIVIFFGKSFKLLDCDPFTKNYMKEMGYRVPSPEPAVIDPVFADRQEMDMHRTQSHKVYQRHYKFAEYLKSHPKKLHFYVIYNSKPSQFEEKRYASMYYDLSDKTIKIIDEKQKLEYRDQIINGYYDTYLILKPTLVPKSKVYLNPITNNSDPVILNVSGTRNFGLSQQLWKRGSNDRPVLLADYNPKTYGTERVDYYTAEDFDLGVTLDVFGSDVYVYDCDEFTKEFYRTEFNRELVPVPLPRVPVSNYHVRNTLGKMIHKEEFENRESVASSMRNVTQKSIEMRDLLGKPQYLASNHLVNFYLNCRFGCERNILSFLSRVVTDEELLQEKYFIIRWYLEDSTIEIAELDSSFTGRDLSTGLRLNRKKIMRPTPSKKNSGPSFYITNDMFIGNVIYAKSRAFLIIDADEYTLKYMEQRSDIFVHSNIKKIMADFFPHFRPEVFYIRSAFEKCDPEKSGFISFNDFKTILIEFIPNEKKNPFLDHQLKILARHFAFENYVGINIKELESKIQLELKRQRFEDFGKLETLFRMFDLDNTEHKGFFKPVRVYKILRSYPLLVDRDLLKSFVFKFPQCNGLISFEELVKSLNYIVNPAQPTDNTPYAININWEHVENVKNVNKILYTALLKEMMKEDCPSCK